MHRGEAQPLTTRRGRTTSTHDLARPADATPILASDVASTCGHAPHTLLVVNRHNPMAAGAAVKETAILLRNARAVLRRLDTLAAQASALDNPSLPRIEEARTVITRLVSEYGHRQQAEQRRARAALRPGR